MNPNQNEPLNNAIIEYAKRQAEGVKLCLIVTEKNLKLNELRTEEVWLCYYRLGYCLEVAKYFLQDDLEHLPEGAQSRAVLSEIMTKLQELIEQRRDTNGVC